MVKKEEEQKEDVETQSVSKQILEEEYKAECLEKSFEEKELDDEFIESEKESMDDIEEVQQEARKKIINARNTLKKSIQQMKVRQNNRLQGLQSKLKKIRTKMTREIMLANKNGDQAVCKKGKDHPGDVRETYCNNNFVDDWTRNADCKGEDFCYICCENEFGAMFVTQRDNCYKMCDFKPKTAQPEIKKLLTPLNIRQDIKQDAPTNDGVGGWVWVPKNKVQ